MLLKTVKILYFSLAFSIPLLSFWHLPFLTSLMALSFHLWKETLHISLIIKSESLSQLNLKSLKLYSTQEHFAGV